MKLPDISLGPVQNDAAAAQERVTSAIGGLSSVVQQGLASYAQEVVKSQTAEAHLQLSKGLDDLDQELRTRKAIPVEELKQRLGDQFDKLSDQVKNSPMVPVTSMDAQSARAVIGAGVGVPMKQADIPTWAVAGALHEKLSKDLLGQATQNITVGSGWQGRFQQAARADILTRSSRMNEFQMQAMHEYQVDTRTRQVMQAANTGDFEMAGVLLDSSAELLGPDLQGKIRAQVDTIQQTKPIYDAMRMVRDPAYTEEGLAQLNAAVATLGDPAKYQNLSPEQRMQLSHEARSAMDTANRLINERTAANLAFQYANDARDKQNPLRVNPQVAFDKLDADFKAGKFKPEVWPVARRLLQEHIKDRLEASRLALNNTSGDAMAQFMALGPDGQPRMSFANLRPDTVAQLHAYGEDGEKVLEQLIKWDQANESHARNMRNLPSFAESAKALAIERALAVNPGKYRGMGTGEFLHILAGGGNDEIPAGAVSSRDIPKLSEAFAKNSKMAPTAQLTAPEKVAFEEAEAAFPSLKGRGSADARVARQSEGVREAIHDLSDRLASFIDDNRDNKGQPPSQDKVRAEAKRLLQTVEVRKKFLGLIPYTGATTRIQAEREGQEYTVPSQRPSTPPVAKPVAPARQPPKPGMTHVTNGKDSGWAPAGGKLPAGWRED